MDIQLLLSPRAHREAISRILRSHPQILRIVTLHLYDVRLFGGEDVKLFGGPWLSNALIRLRAWGIPLTIIVGEVPDQETQDVLSRLANFGARIYINTRVHAKTILSYSPERKCSIIITSANLSKRALYQAHELGILLDEADQSIEVGVRDFIHGIIGDTPRTRGIEEYVA